MLPKRNTGGLPECSPPVLGQQAYEEAKWGDQPLVFSNLPVVGYCCVGGERGQEEERGGGVAGKSAEVGA